jgi:integration host factor subunit beta
VPRLRDDGCFSRRKKLRLEKQPLASAAFFLYRKINRLSLAEPMTKSELIEAIALKQTHLMQKDVELAVKLVLDHVSNALARQERVEIRGFGSFALHSRPARVGRNPKTGEAVRIPAKHVPHFKPGKEMRERVNLSIQDQSAAAPATPHAGTGKA